jgi:hypothetical protein
MANKGKNKTPTKKKTNLIGLISFLPRFIATARLDYLAPFFDNMPSGNINYKNPNMNSYYKPKTYKK